MKEEKVFMPKSGYLFLFLFLLGIAASVLGIVYLQDNVLLLVASILLGVFCLFFLIGLFVINPNESLVLVLFGAYKGTVKNNGFFWANPFYVRRKISLRARNLDSDPIKVNDKLGNPIMIGVVLVWQVENTYNAAFDVDNYEHFVEIQSEAAIRKLAGAYPYDDIEDEDARITLRGGGEEVNEELERELQERLNIAGIKVMESRISYLAYAQEIAGAMLQRQQATAVVAARTKIVEGAVGMVEMALDMLSKKEIVELDEEKKAAMVSNLLVVLCSEKGTSPVVNTGTLHH
ncbi:MAG: SPFH domain-containing protein [Bacteroidetes bacterium]|jgi:regulator of protease activity HflC (stomatin/prohibitin superfamily)|nr:SPFH domain-containing protein [Bacteroidota bacterium]MBT5527579.1 SPFH domain-containing protein [Cytophagia bacterium]MBT3422579.1 SPFH domain-containing protein [Bacteroidota bacterium]MBT4338692.1 SPFH domain-containing protein [Bacteroidota bacterium]MBT4729100.1 SPFH domain-containing protein [Bacteroidota bacterium]